MSKTIEKLKETWGVNSNEVMRTMENCLINIKEENLQSDFDIEIVNLTIDIMNELYRG